MIKPNYLRLIQYNWKKILLFGLLVMILAGALSFIEPLKYSTTVRFLVIQKSVLGLDPYTAVKSSERVAINLSEIIYTTSFFNKVLESDYNIETDYFETDEEKKRRQWSKMISASVEGGTGLLSISVYHPDRNQSLEIAQAVAATLSNQAREYVGGDVQVKLVDDPLPSRFPVKPNIPLNAFFGLFFGLVLGFIYVVWRAKPGGGYSAV
jgi:capsular polysaccharide biosynthesis protein